VTTKIDVSGTPKTSRTEQTLDSYGNLTLLKQRVGGNGADLHEYVPDRR
jgi:hypothetical protein